MERKQIPQASQEEFSRRVVHYPNVAIAELAPGSKSHRRPAENITVSFVTNDPSRRFATHHHEHKQDVTIMDGECDFVIQRKSYCL